MVDNKKIRIDGLALEKTLQMTVISYNMPHSNGVINVRKNQIGNEEITYGHKQLNK